MSAQLISIPFGSIRPPRESVVRVGDADFARALALLRRAYATLEYRPDYVYLWQAFDGVAWLNATGICLLLARDALETGEEEGDPSALENWARETCRLAGITGRLATRWASAVPYGEPNLWCLPSGVRCRTGLPAEPWVPPLQRRGKVR